MRIMATAIWTVFGGALLVAPTASAQTFTVSPTYQESLATYEGRVADPSRGDQAFHAWGVMAGLERPGRFWQPHVWYQRYSFENACRIPSEGAECGNDGWALSIGPGLEVVETPRLSGMLLAQVGIQSRGGQGFTGGAGFHLGVKIGRLRPTAFGAYQVIRGVHYATVGAGLMFQLARGGGPRSGPAGGR